MKEGMRIMANIDRVIRSFRRDERHLTKVFKALSDGTRQEILRLLEGRQRTVGEIVGNFNLSQPEWSVRVNQRGRELGLTARDVGTAVRGLFDGAFVDDFRLPDDTVDLMAVPSGGRRSSSAIDFFRLSWRSCSRYNREAIAVRTSAA